MKTFKLYFLLFAIALGFACKKKEYPQSVIENEAVFSFNGSINNAPTNIQVGVNDYYMYSSYKQDSNNVYNFIANIKQANCNTCGNSLQVQINNAIVSPYNGSTQIGSAFYIGYYSYLSGEASTSYSVQFQSSYNKTAGSYYWNFGDGTSSTLPNPTHIYKHGRYNTCLTINGTNGCVSNVCSFQRLDYLTSHCNVSVADSDVTSNTKAFISNISGSAPYSYLWSFGDGGTSTSSNPTHTYLVEGSYPVSLRVIDANNDTVITNYNTVTKNDFSSCAANYKASVTKLPTLALSNVIITWVDASGNVYTSNNASQPTTSTFQIISVDDFKSNENGQLTKKIHIKFSCLVYNGTNAIAINNAEAVIAVAYK